MLTDHEPSSTRLINIPVIFNNQNYKLLLYTNDLDISNEPVTVSPILDNKRGNMNGLDRSLEVLSNQHMTNGFQSDKKGALMIVPIPNIYNINDFGLVDVSTDKMKHFRKTFFEKCDKLKPVTRGLNFSYSNNLSSGKKMVHEIGNYRISVANNLDDLMNNIDWSKFELPSNFNDRFSTLQDSNLYPDKQYAYVVAQSQKSVKDDGFGIAYPDVGYEYFPTAHEIPNNHIATNESSNISSGSMNNFQNNFGYNVPINQGKKSNDVKYDVKIYNLTDKQRQHVQFGQSSLKFYNLDNHSVIYDLLSLLDLNMIMSRTGQRAIYSIDSQSQLFNFTEMSGYMNNQNLMLEY